MKRCKQCGRFSLFGYPQYQDGLCPSCWEAYMERKIAFHEMRKPVHESYFQLDNQFRSFRITTMTKSDFESFYAVGLDLLNLLPQYVVMIHNDETSTPESSYFYENVPIKLLDYCCRFGEFEKGNYILEFMAHSNVFRKSFFKEQFNLFHQRCRAIRCVSDYISRNDETSKNIVIKNLPFVEKDDLLWAMRFYKGFSVRKDGSKYFVSLCDIA